MALPLGAALTMGLRIDFTILGDKIISRELLRLSARGLDARPAFEEIADQFMRAEKVRFATKGNGTWRPLAPSTIKAKGHSRILVDTGALRRSLTHRGDPGQELIVGPLFMVFGTNVEYAIFHQQGWGVPVRKPVGFTENAKRSAVRTLQTYIVTGHTKP